MILHALLVLVFGSPEKIACTPDPRPGERSQEQVRQANALWTRASDLEGTRDFDGAKKTLEELLALERKDSAECDTFVADVLTAIGDVELLRENFPAALAAHEG